MIPKILALFLINIAGIPYVFSMESNMEEIFTTIELMALQNNPSELPRSPSPLNDIPLNTIPLELPHSPHISCLSPLEEVHRINEKLPRLQRKYDFHREKAGVYLTKIRMYQQRLEAIQETTNFTPAPTTPVCPEPIPLPEKEISHGVPQFNTLRESKKRIHRRVPIEASPDYFKNFTLHTPKIGEIIPAPTDKDQLNKKSETPISTPSGIITIPFTSRGIPKTAYLTRFPQISPKGKRKHKKLSQSMGIDSDHSSSNR